MSIRFKLDMGLAYDISIASSCLIPVLLTKPKRQKCLIGLDWTKHSVYNANVIWQKLIQLNKAFLLATVRRILYYFVVSWIYLLIEHALTWFRCAAWPPHTRPINVSSNIKKYTFKCINHHRGIIELFLVFIEMELFHAENQHNRRILDYKLSVIRKQQGNLDR